MLSQSQQEGGQTGSGVMAKAGVLSELTGKCPRSNRREPLFHPIRIMYICYKYYRATWVGTILHVCGHTSKSLM